MKAGLGLDPQTEEEAIEVPPPPRRDPQHLMLEQEGGQTPDLPRVAVASPRRIQEISQEIRQETAIRREEAGEQVMRARLAAEFRGQSFREARRER